MSDQQNNLKPKSPDREPIPALNDIVPPWTREPGKTGRTKAERAAKKVINDQRAAVQAVLDRLRAAEAENDELTESYQMLVDDTALRQAQHARETRELSLLQRLRRQLPTVMSVAALAAAASRQGVKGVTFETDSDGELVVRYSLERGTLVVHRASESADTPQKLEVGVDHELMELRVMRGSSLTSPLRGALRGYFAGPSD